MNKCKRWALRNAVPAYMQLHSHCCIFSELWYWNPGITLQIDCTYTPPFCHQSLNKPCLSRYSESSLCSWQCLEGGRKRKGRRCQETTCGSGAFSMQPAKELLSCVLFTRPVDHWRSAGYRCYCRWVWRRVKSQDLRWKQGNLASLWQPKAVAWSFSEVPWCCLYFFLCSSISSVGGGRMREL